MFCCDNRPVIWIAITLHDSYLFLSRDLTKMVRRGESDGIFVKTGGRPSWRPHLWPCLSSRVHSRPQVR
jgi:hypothetical protein